MSVLDDDNNIIGIGELINSSPQTLEELQKQMEKKTSPNHSETYKQQIDNILKELETKSEKENSVHSGDANNSENDEIASRNGKTIITTDEELQQTRIRSIIGGSQNFEEFSLDKEQEEDDKLVLLEQIDMLKQILTDDGINVSTVAQVNINSSIKDIKNVSRILKLKNDRNRLSSLTEEGILLIAAGMEFFFDGQTTYFGTKPDLVGWSDTVKIKLRRLKFETSSIVCTSLRSSNIGSGMRIALELIPSMILYSRLKSQNKSGIDNSRADEKYKKAINELNNI
jgi:hypothetical protein